MSHGPITVRRLTFDIPASIDPIVMEGCPEESFTVVGLSLLLPYLEPYLIRTMKEAVKRVDEPALRADVEAFNGQEGQHYRQHMRFNDAVRAGGVMDLDALEALEAEVDADYKRFSVARSLRWNMAYAEGFEAFTSALAQFSFEVGQLERMTPAARDVFTWHLVEELVVLFFQ